MMNRVIIMKFESDITCCAVVWSYNNVVAQAIAAIVFKVYAIGYVPPSSENNIFNIGTLRRRQ